MNIFQNPDRRCILWNKLGNQKQIDKSEIGANGIIYGSLAYQNCKFYKGVETNSNEKIKNLDESKAHSVNLKDKQTVDEKEFIKDFIDNREAILIDYENTKTTLGLT